MKEYTNEEILKRLKDVKPLIVNQDADRISGDVLFAITELSYKAFEEYLKYNTSCSASNSDLYKAFDYLHSIKTILLSHF